jgi:hypothetical protein
LNESEAKFLFLGYELEPEHFGFSIDLDTVVTTIVVGGPDDEYEGWLEAHETHEGMMKSAREIAQHKVDDAVLRLYYSQGKNGPTRAEHTHRSLLAAASETIRRKAIRPEDVDVIDVSLSRTPSMVRALAGMAAGAVTTLVREE